MEKVVIVCIIAVVAVLCYKRVDTARIHDTKMHEEHSVLMEGQRIIHEENKAIYAKVKENGEKLDRILKYIEDCDKNAVDR